MNVTNVLKNRLKLLENIMEIINDDVSFHWMNPREIEDLYLDEETIKEWFQDKINEEEGASPVNDLEVITFRKLHLSLKRNTSIKSSIKKMSRVFALNLNPVEDSMDSKSAALKSKSKFSVTQQKNSTSSGLKEIPRNNVKFNIFSLLKSFIDHKKCPF